MLFAKYGRPEGKFGHDTGRHFLIVRGPTLKNYYAKTIKDRDLIFVALSSQCNAIYSKNKSIIENICANS